MPDATLNAASLSYAATYLPEDELLERARERGAELGCTPVGGGTGATLRLLAALTAAHAVVEVGTGAGVSGLWLLRGMRPDGVLTTVDVEAENQRAARETFLEAGVAPSRFRMINGSAAEVLPRLTDGAYDLVFIDADKSAYPVYAEQALRLLRPGGVVALDNMLFGDRVADAAVRDHQTNTLRELARSLREDERLVPALLPVGDGLLVAMRR